MPVKNYARWFQSDVIQIDFTKSLLNSVLIVNLHSMFCFSEGEYW